MNKIQEEYTSEIGQKKFKQYDYNNSGGIGLDEFKSMLQKDYHCRKWMEVMGFSEAIIEEEEYKEKPLNH